MKTIGDLCIEIIIGNGVVNILFDAFEKNERCVTLDVDSFEILAKRLNALAGKDQGHDLMSFRLYPNELPIDDDPPDGSED